MTVLTIVHWTLTIGALALFALVASELPNLRKSFRAVRSMTHNTGRELSVTDLQVHDLEQRVTGIENVLAGIDEAVREADKKSDEETPDWGEQL